MKNDSIHQRMEDDEEEKGKNDRKSSKRKRFCFLFFTRKDKRSKKMFKNR